MLLIEKRTVHETEKPRKHACEASGVLKGMPENDYRVR